MTDSADDVVALLNAGWIVGSGGTKPTIGLVESFKRIDLGGNLDYVLVYMLPAAISPVGTGYGHEQKFQSVSIDIRTTTDKTRLLQILNEVKRIMHVNRTKGANGLHDLIIVEKSLPLSNKSIKLWREVLDVSIRDYAIEIP